MPTLGYLYVHSLHTTLYSNNELKCMNVVWQDCSMCCCIYWITKVCMLGHSYNVLSIFLNFTQDFSVLYDVEPGPTNRYSCPTVRRVYVSDQKKPVPVSLDSGKKKQKHGFDRMVSQVGNSEYGTQS